MILKANQKYEQALKEHELLMQQMITRKSEEDQKYNELKLKYESETLALRNEVAQLGLKCEGISSETKSNIQVQGDRVIRKYNKGVECKAC